MGQVVLINRFDPKSKLYFKNEKNYLSKILSKFSKSIKIIHFGSTAVPKLGGKNIIDTFIVSNNRRILNKLTKEIENKTNYLKWRTPSKQRILFIKKRKIGRKLIIFHLHVTWKTASEYKNAIILKNYLASHPNEAKRYFLLKKLWAKKAGSKPRRYLEAKTNYILSIIKRTKNK